ncbi:MAG: hypothetical protein KJ773_09675 [Candidatus Thermoplasmatota archaeon]|nr:hypothetical protein [Candidatus Thermoplasmatota archaeon]
MAKTELIKIVPNRGIRILDTDKTKEIMASQLPEWYTELMEKYVKEMKQTIKV